MSKSVSMYLSWVCRARSLYSMAMCPWQPRLRHTVASTDCCCVRHAQELSSHTCPGHAMTSRWGSQSVNQYLHSQSHVTGLTSQQS